MVQQVARLDVFSGWKEIANYLRKGVRTVQRYERELGLPVRRPAGRSRGSVIATKIELDAWITAKPVREAFRLTQETPDTSSVLKEFRLQIQQMHQLRFECQESRRELARSMEIMQQRLRTAMPQRIADVLIFDPKKKAN
jgi:hypothetical protein